MNNVKIIGKIIITIAIGFLISFMIHDLVFADENIDYKDYYSSNIIINKDDAALRWIITDDKKKQFFSLDECDKELYVSAANGLNVRPVPTINSKPIKTLVYGEPVNVIGKQIENNNMWVLIKYNDDLAFVWSEYLTTDRPILNPSISKYDELQNVTDEVYDTSSDSDMTYLGNYMCTAYEWTGDPCANGNYPTEGYTVACNSLDFGTQIYIEGYGYYVVEDCGGGGDQWIDIYMGDVSTCNNFGIKYLDVYVVN